MIKKAREPIENPAVTLRHLRELIAAIDRRVPQIARVGEVDIALDAAALRDKALARIAELEARKEA
jgi:hypothetical protein